MPQRGSSYFHLHLVSDATGETLTTVARAATAQYTKIEPVEHVYPLVRTQKQLDRVLAEIEESPGIVLYTLLEDDLVKRLEDHCRELSVPCLSILGPVLALLQSYLGAETSHRVGAQHMLNAEYFKRIDALNYTMLHDDGQHIDGLEEADVVLVGVSRTSKTPTSIYLANRGVKTGNVPLVPGIPIAPSVEKLEASAGGRAVCQPGADRADPAEPPARAEGPSRRGPVHRPQGGGRGDRVLPQALRQAQLAEHRRDPPLDRGDGRGRAQAPGGTPAASGDRRRPCRSGVPTSRSCSRPGARSGARCSRLPAFRSRSFRPILTSGRIEAKARGVNPGAVAALLAREKAQRRVGESCPDGWCWEPIRRWRSASADFPSLRIGPRRGRSSWRCAAKTHELHAAIAAVRDGAVVFEHGDVARLTMREFSESFLDSYLEAAGDAVTASVGGYQLERLGIHLFERIEGDHDTILGLPLLPLLHYLRRSGLLAK